MQPIIAILKIKGSEIAMPIYTTNEIPKPKMAIVFGVRNQLAQKHKVSNSNVMKIIMGEEYTRTYKGIRKAIQIKDEYDQLEVKYNNSVEQIKKLRKIVLQPGFILKRDNSISFTAKKMKIEASYARSIIKGKYTPTAYHSLLFAIKTIECFLLIKKTAVNENR